MGRKINKRKSDIGADGALLRDNTDEIYHVNFIEKILATVLAKCQILFRKLVFG